MRYYVPLNSRTDPLARILSLKLAFFRPVIRHVRLLRRCPSAHQENATGFQADHRLALYGSNSMIRSRRENMFLDGDSPSSLELRRMPKSLFDFAACRLIENRVRVLIDTDRQSVAHRMDHFS